MIEINVKSHEKSKNDFEPLTRHRRSTIIVLVNFYRYDLFISEAIKSLKTTSIFSNKQNEINGHCSTRSNQLKFNVKRILLKKKNPSRMQIA